MSTHAALAAEVTITPHAIASYVGRARVGAVRAAEDLRALVAVAKLARQDVYRAGKGRSARVNLKGRDGADLVDVLHADVFGARWILFMRGRVLLTAHGPFRLGALDEVLVDALPEDLVVEPAAVANDVDTAAAGGELAAAGDAWPTDPVVAEEAREQLAHAIYALDQRIARLARGRDRELANDERRDACRRLRRVKAWLKAQRVLAPLVKDATTRASLGAIARVAELLEAEGR